MIGLTIFLLIIISEVQADYFNIGLTGIECQKESDLLSNVTCYIKAVNRTTQLINADLYNPQKLDDVFMNIVLMRKFGAMYRQFMVNITDDFCSYMDGKTGLISNILFPYSKEMMYNFKCPIHGQFGVRDFEPRINAILGSLPLGFYRLDVKFYEGKQLFAKFKISGTWTDKLRKIKHHSTV